MRNARRILPVLFVAMFALLLASLSQVMFAKVTTSAHPEVRVTKKVDNSKRTTLYGHVSAATRIATDLGRQEPQTPSPGMIMVLKSDENQKHEIRKVIDEQQDKRTANYHQWVTPEEFGEHFGVDDGDIAQIKAWLTSEGFTVDEVSKSKRVIKFSGNIGQVEHAFQTEMHLYGLNGAMHVANSTDVSVPEAFNKVIAGVTLHNFYRKGNMGPVSRMKLGGTIKGKGPKYTSSSSVHYVAPTDFATIYNTAPLLAAGINGSGETIAIVGRSDILLSDVQSYRQLFNLPPNDPTFIHAGQDNGTEPGDDGESDLDVEVSGGMAPNAHVDFVIGTPTFLVDGITNSVEYIVENNLADIMSISYGDCEFNEGVGGNEFNSQAFEQAAAQGISVFIASGDNGPAGCDDQNDSYEVLGYAAGAESSTWYSVAVGGTEMYGECTAPGVGCSQANESKYWAAANNNLYLSSALEYIPEVPWNDAKGSISTASASSALSGLWSSSGGVSAYYMRPPWQQGANSAILASSTDPAMIAYLSSSGGTITPESPGYWVTGVTLTNGGGSGYVTGTSYTVTFSGGTCTTLPASGATTVADINGSLTGPIAFFYGTQGGTVAAGQGLNCTVAPTVAFQAPPSGVTATGTATLGPMTMQPPLVSGVPHRLTPDMALNASSSHDATLFCSEGVCEFTTNAAGQNTIADAGLVGGTSVAAPSMAGIQALINNYNAVNNPEPGNPTGRQGMPGYVYYGLAAAQSDTTCNSNALVPPNDANLTTCPFQDIQSGNTYICGTSTCTSSSGTKIGWPTGVGYDLNTGLGSVNAYNMATKWNTVVFNSTATTLNAPTGGAHGGAVTLSGTITPDPGTGDVAFLVSQGEIGDPVNLTTGAFVYPGAYATVDVGCVGAGCFSLTLNNLPGGASPYNITARYGGNGTYASSVSAPQPITVGTEPVNITLTPQLITQTTTCDISNFSGPFTYGQLVWVQVTVAGVSGYGVPTGSVTITDSINGGPTNTIATTTLDPQGNGYLVTGAITTTSCLLDYIFAQSPTLIGGSHSLSATYSGDATFQSPGTPTPATVTVTPLSVTPTLTSTAADITTGFPVQLVATFAAQSGLTSTMNTGSSGPTGTVTFTDTFTSTVLGTASVVPTVTFTGPGSGGFPSYTYAGTAVLSTSNITATGANTITATYAGDSNYSGPVTSTPVTVAVGTDAATTTTLPATGSTTLGGRPTFTATITGLTGATSGTVTFYDATYGVVLGTAAVSTTGTKTATFRLGTTPAFVGGNHNVVATYGGVTGTASASTSGVQVETVAKGNGAVILTTKGVGESGQTYTFAAVFTPSSTSTSYTPTLGVMTFFDAVNGGASAAIGTGVPNYIGAEMGGYGLWTAPLVTTLSTPGTHVITASYTDVNYTSSVSNAVTVYVGNTQITSNDVGIYFPLPGSTLPAVGPTNFKWFPVAGTQYWLDVGSTQGGNQYYTSGNNSPAGEGTNLAKVVPNAWPLNGSPVWARLYVGLTPIGGGPVQWSSYTDAEYNTINNATAVATMASPTAGSNLCGSCVTFVWNAASPTPAGYWLEVTDGPNVYYNAAVSSATTTVTVCNLPTDGSTVTVTLWTNVGTGANPSWQANQYNYYAVNAGTTLAIMSSPSNGTPISGTTATFTWTISSAAAACGDDYWMDIQTDQGTYQSGNLGSVNTFTPPSGTLPNDGSNVTVVLYTTNPYAGPPAGYTVLGNTQDIYPNP